MRLIAGFLLRYIRELVTIGCLGGGTFLIARSVHNSFYPVPGATHWYWDAKGLALGAALLGAAWCFRPIARACDCDLHREINARPLSATSIGEDLQGDASPRDDRQVIQNLANHGQQDADGLTAIQKQMVVWSPVACIIGMVGLNLATGAPIYAGLLVTLVIAITAPFTLKRIFMSENAREGSEAAD